MNDQQRIARILASDCARTALTDEDVGRVVRPDLCGDEDCACMDKAARIAPKMKFWLLGVMVSKQGQGMTTHSMVTGYRVCETENEARGSFVTNVFKMKPGYSIDDVSCAEVPPDAFPPQS